MLWIKRTLDIAQFDLRKDNVLVTSKPTSYFIVVLTILHKKTAAGFRLFIDVQLAWEMYVNILTVHIVVKVLLVRQWSSSYFKNVQFSNGLEWPHQKKNGDKNEGIQYMMFTVDNMLQTVWLKRKMALWYRKTTSKCSNTNYTRFGVNGINVWKLVQSVPFRTKQSI